MTISFGSIIALTGTVTIDPLLTKSQLGHTVGNLTISGSQSNNVTVPGAYPYTILSNDNIIAVDTSAARTINLPAAPTTGNLYVIKDVTGGAGTNNITVSGNGNNIDGSATFIMNVAYEGAEFIYGASQWAVLSSVKIGTATSWVNQTTTPVTMVVGNGYSANNVGLVTLTLPATAIFGSVISVSGQGAGGWLIAQNAGQTIHFGSTNTTPGITGSLASTNRYDNVSLLCSVANTDFVVLDSVGNLTVV